MYIKTGALKNDASSEITKFQGDIFFKEHSWKRRMIFYIIDHSVCDQLLPYLK